MIWECICDCGNHTMATYTNLKRGHKKSCGCNITEYIDSLTYDLTGKKFGMLTVEYYAGKRERDDRRIWHCRCDCGNEVDIDVNSLVSEHTRSCGCTHKSFRELYIENILKENSIHYISQYTFKDCKNIFELPFDFYLPDINTIIEYDGEQHFKPIEFFGGQDGFNKRQKNDSIKTQYCIDNDIRLIRIPYTKTDKEIKEIILNI